MHYSTSLNRSSLNYHIWRQHSWRLVGSRTFSIPCFGQLIINPLFPVERAVNPKQDGHRRLVITRLRGMKQVNWQSVGVTGSSGQPVLWGEETIQRQLLRASSKCWYLRPQCRVKLLLAHEWLHFALQKVLQSADLAAKRSLFLPSDGHMTVRMDFSSFCNHTKVPVCKLKPGLLPWWIPSHTWAAVTNTDWHMTE